MASQDPRAPHAPSPTAAAEPDATHTRTAAVSAAVASEPSAARSAGDLIQGSPSITNSNTVTMTSDVGPHEQKSPNPEASAEWQHSSSTPQEWPISTSSKSSSSSNSSNTSGGSGSGLLPPAAATESLAAPQAARSRCLESSANDNSSSSNASSSSSSAGSSSSNSKSSSSDKGQPARYGIPSGEESMKALRRHVELLMDREGNARTRSRLESCLDALEPQELDLQLLRVVCAKGLPEGCAALRSIYWRLLLHCLPPKPSDWQQRRCKLREAYESYKAEFIREPEAVRRLRRMQQQQQQQQRQQQREAGIDETKEDRSSPATASHDRTARSSGATPISGRHQSDSSIPLAAVKDHPLCRSATSEWRGYWVDAEVFDQINKDVFRTRPELCFFALNPQQTVTRQQQLHLYPPPPTRQTQTQQQQNDPVPLLVNYDLLLQQQQQLQQQQEQQKPPRASSNPADERARASSKHTRGSSTASSSSLKSFRLPSAFRTKKRLLSASAAAAAAAARVWGPPAEVAHRGKQQQGAAAAHCSRMLEWRRPRGKETSKKYFRLLPQSAHWLEGQQMDVAKKAGITQATMRSSSSSSSNSSCKSSSYLDPRLSSRESLESDSSFLQAPAVSLRSSLPSSREIERAGQLADSLRAEDATAAAAVDADAPTGAKVAGKEAGFQPLSDSVEDCAAAAAAAAATAALAGDGGGGTAVQQPTGEAVQPWRAPAGVQDVCNMITPHRHYDVLSRLLFIYAKVNAGLCYVQGMNEILAPIYYALMTDPTYTDYEQAEAEIFYCFSEVMQQQRDAFCKALDPTDAGVRGRLASLDALLRKKDEEVWMHLNAVGVEPQFYALRWLLLMLTQEFEMPDVLALWDGFIADAGRPLPLLYYVCVAIVIWLRPALLAGDFTACMKLLQHLPSFDPKALLSSAMRLRADDLEGNASTASRVPRPVSEGGQRRSREGLEDLDPLQQMSDSFFKPISRAIAALSLNEGLGAGTSEAARPVPAAAEAGGERGWKKGVFLPPSLLGEGSASKGESTSKESGEGPDAAIGHLKRLAGVGVEHAYRGASVVSQYFNNSGLASGLASNITSFFGGDSTPSSAVAPPEAAGDVAAERPRQSAAAKLGEFFAAAQTGLSAGAKGGAESRIIQPDRGPDAVLAPDAVDAADSAPPLIEYPFSPVEEGVGEAVERPPETDEDPLQEISPRQRSLWETDTTAALKGRLGDAEDITDSPRSDADEQSFKSAAQPSVVTEQCRLEIVLPSVDISNLKFKTLNPRWNSKLST
ncbi:LOW QUALITY PROTEIN: uncharacterized protein EMH_0008230 [Eimeria mitis]|uniref:Rab-GAP TBC domain-containing protein n=1 Tax=Eimeria mitis TaxID=44415 RepID=U6K0A1_9EIME|nr:LOW QUALITY PROTEIN: uncharacterized protein EMH_0008230 [Eimeria mitis]CDJ31170.1 hypothetical protein, conserved [Eimeria mitis]